MFCKRAMHQDKNGIVAAKLVESAPNYWLVETSLYVALIAPKQIGGLLPKKFPFVTGGYWDDIALAALATGDNGSLIVLGGGIGSFIALAMTYHPSLRLVCVEINEEIALCGRQFCRRLHLAGEHWIVTGALQLSPAAWSGVATVFFDLSLADHISPINVDVSFHEEIKRRLPDDGLVFINISDSEFPKQRSATVHFSAILLNIYSSGVILRRQMSSTLVCAKNCSEVQLLSRLQLMLKQAAPTAVAEIRQIIPVSTIEPIVAKDWYNLLRLDGRVETDADKQQASRSTLLRSMIATLLDLKWNSDLLRLSNNVSQSHFLCTQPPKSQR